jgi:hypothetical protein
MEYLQGALDTYNLGCRPPAKNITYQHSMVRSMTGTMNAKHQVDAGRLNINVIADRNSTDER